MIENKENISLIIMKPFAECLCAIGNDWYHIDFEICFMPDGTYPDYMTVSEYISKCVSGKRLNIEEAVNMIGVMLKEKYKPKELSVKGIVDKVITHFPVEVLKEF